MSEIVRFSEPVIDQQIFAGAASSELRICIGVEDGKIIFQETKRYANGPMNITFFWTLNGAFGYARERSKMLGDTPVVLESDLLPGTPLPERMFPVRRIIIPQSNDELGSFTSIMAEDQMRSFIVNTQILSNNSSNLVLPQGNIHTILDFSS